MFGGSSKVMYITHYMMVHRCPLEGFLKVDAVISSGITSVMSLINYALNCFIVYS